MFAGLPLLPLLDGSLATIQAFTFCSEACYAPSKLDAELLRNAQDSLVDLSNIDRECSDRWSLPLILYLTAVIQSYDCIEECLCYTPH